MANVHGNKKKITDFIGEHPRKEREKKKQQQLEDVSTENDRLRKIALDKGLNVNW